MTHLDPDRLADRALGTDDPLTAAEQKSPGRLRRVSQ